MHLKIFGHAGTPGAIGGASRFAAPKPAQPPSCLNASFFMANAAATYDLDFCDRLVCEQCGCRYCISEVSREGDCILARHAMRLAPRPRDQPCSKAKCQGQYQCYLNHGVIWKDYTPCRGGAMRLRAFSRQAVVPEPSMLPFSSIGPTPWRQTSHAILG